MVKFTDDGPVEEDKEVFISERAKRYSLALRDAQTAFDLAGVRPTSEDLRTVATTFMIDEGKNERMDRIKNLEPQVDTPMDRVANEATQPITKVRQLKCGICGSEAYSNKYKKPGTKMPDFKCDCGAGGWDNGEKGISWRAGKPYNG